jgi:hypothetical protein
MMVHRQRLAINLKAMSGLDLGTPIRQVNEDIAAIGAGLTKMDSSPPYSSS